MTKTTLEDFILLTQVERLWSALLLIILTRFCTLWDKLETYKSSNSTFFWMIHFHFWTIHISQNNMAWPLSFFYLVFASGKKSDRSLMPFSRTKTLNRQQKVILSWFYWMILDFKNSPKIGILIYLHTVFGKSSQIVQIFII